MKKFIVGLLIGSLLQAAFTDYRKRVVAALNRTDYDVMES